MNLLRGKERLPGSRKMALLPLSIAAAFVAVQAQAQPFYPQNPLSSFLNGLGASIARQQAIEAARQAWSGVDPTMYQCLMRTLSPAPPVLAGNGISPSDPRLQPYFQRCAIAIAQANAQREAAARQAAEEQQREQAAREAQQAEQAREDAERRAQELATEKAQQVEKQRFLAERRAEEAAFAKLRAIPELSSYIGRTEPALIFLYVSSSKRLIRGLDGKVSAAGQERPVACWAFSTTGASSAGFFLWAMKRLEVDTHAENFELVPCTADLPDYENADVVLFSTTDLVQTNALEALQLGQSIDSGRLDVLLEASQEEYDAKVAADRKQQEEAAVEAKARAAKVEGAVDSGAELGVAVLTMQPGAEGPICIVEPVDFDTVKQAIVKFDDQRVIKQIARIEEVDRLSADEAFLGVKSGKCGLLTGDAASLREIRAALKRDGFSPGTGLVWISAADFKQAGELVAQQRQAQVKAKTLAKEEEAKKVAEQQAQEKAAEAAAAAERARKIAKDRAATDQSSQLIDHP